MIEVTQADYIDGFRIHITFSTGESGVVDLAKSLWGPAFEPLRSIERFRRFYLSPVVHTIAWDNDVDFAPEYLRKQMIEQAATAEATHG